VRLSTRNVGRSWRRWRGLPLDEHVIVIEPWRVAYFRIPKAANTSIKTALVGSLGLPTIPGLGPTRDKYWRIVAPRKVDIIRPRTFATTARYANYWSFSVVREPAARLVSCYKNKIKRNKRLSPSLLKLGFDRKMSMDDFVHHACALGDEVTDVHLQSQASILVHAGRLLPKLIVRVEELDGQWPHVQERVRAHAGVELARLKHANRTDGVRRQSPLGPELLELVRARYSEDYRLFYPFAPGE